MTITRRDILNGSLLSAVEAGTGKIGTAKKFASDLQEIGLRHEQSTSYEWDGAEILTDNFAPVYLYQHQNSDAR